MTLKECDVEAESVFRKHIMQSEFLFLSLFAYLILQKYVYFRSHV